MKTIENPAIQQIFDAMIAGDRVLISDERRSEYQEDYNETIENELHIENIDSNESVALYSENVCDVLYDFSRSDLIIIL